MPYRRLPKTDQARLHALQKAVQRNMTRVNPPRMPKLKGIAPLKPRRAALVMDMILLGPGVMAVIKA